MVLTPELIAYIKERMEAGASKEEVQSALSNVGWRQEDIDEAFAQMYAPPTPKRESIPLGTETAIPVKSIQPQQAQNTQSPSTTESFTPTATPAQASPAQEPQLPPDQTEPTASQETLLGSQKNQITPAIEQILTETQNAEEPATPSNDKTESATRPKLSNFPKIIIGIVTTVILGAAIGFGAFLFFGNTNAKLANALVSALAEVHSFQYSGTLTSQSNNTEVVVALKGTIDGSSTPTKHFLALTLIPSGLGLDTTTEGTDVYIQLKNFALTSVEDQIFKTTATSLFKDASAVQFLHSLFSAKNKTQVINLRKAWQNNSLITFTQRSANADSLLKYDFNINPQNFTTWIDATLDALDQTSLDAQAVANQLSFLAGASGTITMQKDTNLPSAITINFADSHLELTLTEFNQSQVIQVPTTTIPLGKALFNIITEARVSLSQINPGLYVDTDNDGLVDFLEKFYSTDPSNPDSDGDGFQDGEEVQNEYSPLGPGKLEF